MSTVYGPGQASLVSIDEGLVNDLRALFRAARGIRNTLHKLTDEGVSSKPDWDFARQVKRVFSTMDNLTALVTLIETKQFAPEEECPHCGGKL